MEHQKRVLAHREVHIGLVNFYRKGGGEVGHVCQLARARANQPVHWFLGGKSLGIQQGTSVWVGLPK